MKLLIGTVSLNTKPLTEIWLETLYRSIRKLKPLWSDKSPSEIKIVVVDNGSTDGVMDLKESYSTHTSWIRNEKNLGVAAAWNQIIKEGFDDNGNPLFDYYFPANNDIFFSENWVENMQKCLEQDTKKEYGWISSFMNDYKEPELTSVTETVDLENRYWGGLRPEADEVISKIQMEGIVKAAYAPWGGLDKFADMLKGKYGLKLKEMHPKAPMFCLSKECIKKVGMFDEAFSPIGVHEDADYCERIKRYSSFKYGAAYGAYLHHFSMMTRTKKEFKNDWVPQREENWIKKWGVSSKEIGNTANVPGMKIDIGCGVAPKDGFGWYHLDIDRRWTHVEFLHDISKGLPFDDYSLDEIYCSNNLEHIEWRNVESVLWDFYMKLRHGGKIEIRVPNFGYLAEEYLKGRWHIKLQDGLELSAIHAILGGEYPGYSHLHKAIFDFQNLSDAMRGVGFIDIKNESQPGSWELRVAASK